MNWKLLLVLFCAMGMLIPFAGCTSEDDDDPPPPPPPTWGPSAIAVGDDALIMVSSDMLTWTEVLQTTSTIPTNDDIDKVVRVPGHANRRLVAIVNDDSTIDDANATIWYNDSGGTTAWTQAWYGTSVSDESYLDAEHRSGAGDDDWNLHDIFFVSATEGYAIGSNYIILRTYDAGATWHDMNAYSGASPTTITYQEINLSSAPPASFIPGATVAGNGTTPGAGTIISVHEGDWEIVIDVTHEFDGTDGDTTVTVGTDTVNISSIQDANIWRLQLRGGLSVFAHETTAGVQTIYFGEDASYTSSGTPGVWRVTTDAVAGASRAYTWTGPQQGEQSGTDEVGDYDINAFFFFDALTGLAATDDGVYYTADGLDWTRYAASDNDVYTGFAYSHGTLTQSGYIYSISNNTSYNPPGRVDVTYAAGSWTLGATWVLHGDTTNFDLWYTDSPQGMFNASGKVFVFENGDANGVIGWCGNPTLATFDNTLWQDSGTQDMGRSSTNGTNINYGDGVLQGTGAPSGWIRCITPR